MSLEQIGSFSFDNDNVPLTIRLDDNKIVKMERHDVDTARVYVANNAGQELPIPSGMKLTHAGKDDVPPVKDSNSFIITWLDNEYTLTLGDRVVMELRTQKQFAVLAPATGQLGVN